MSSPAGRVATNADSLRGRTQWSLVFAGDAGAAPAQEALAELCVRYGFPVYAYLRRCGHAPAAATRGLHGFLQHLDAPRPEAESLPASFRPWLLGELHRFLALPRAADDPAAAPRLSPAELERRYGAEAEPGLSPEAAYHRDFAREVLARAQQRLHAEAAQAGREALYTQLAPYLAREPAQGQYELLAEATGSRPLALVTAVKRLRQRFRELVDAELAETVAGPGDLPEERIALRHALAS